MSNISYFAILIILSASVFIAHSLPNTHYEVVGLEIPSNISLTIPLSERISFDEENIPFVDYGDGIGKQRYPLTVARNAENLYEKFIRTGNSEFKQEFINNADWLANKAKLVTSPSGIKYMVLESEFPFRENIYQLTPPWISAMVHGEALSPLYHAFVVTGNQTYYDVAKLILNSFFVPTDEGGATIKFPDYNGWWYEEYPSPFQGGSRVLNGMLFSVLGIYKYYNSTNDLAAKYLFDQGVTALKNELHRYDFKNGTWSYYDFYPGQLAAVKYQKVHVLLLERLFEITGEKHFDDFAQKWFQSLLVNNEIALANNSNNIKSLTARGVALHNLGNLTDALELYDNVLTIDPANTKIMLYKGIALHNLGNLTGALELYDNVLTIDPDNSKALENKELLMRMF